MDLENILLCYSAEIGAVVIGRNEGHRLLRCLKSLDQKIENIVYVDSGSSDGSPAFADSIGVTVLKLDLRTPFTAARARNEGAKILIEKFPDIKYIQFVDGDCEIQTGWLDKAYQFLEAEPNYAVVCGRRRERAPETTIYNELCDTEWNTPIGDALSCGGDALIRRVAYEEVKGYRDNLIAGEEPEMCLRMRMLNWKVMRLDEEMTLHDAAMTKFSQWWRRSVRAGYAFAMISNIHKNSSERLWEKETKRIYFWVFVIPSLIILSASFVSPWSVFLFLIYPLQIVRLALLKKNKIKSAWLWAMSNVLSKFPEAQGAIKYHLDRLFNKSITQIIEYK